VLGPGIASRGNAMSVGPGDIINMASFTAYQPNVQASFKAPRGRVAVFMLLGDADKKSPDTFDCHKALNDLGWHREDEPKYCAVDDLYEALANLENDAGQIPEHAWKLVQAALKKARGEE